MGWQPVGMPEFDIDNPPPQSELTEFTEAVLASGDVELMRRIGEYNERIAKDRSAAGGWYRKAGNLRHIPSCLDAARLAAERGDPDKVQSWLGAAETLNGGQPIVGRAYDVLGVDENDKPIAFDSDECNWGGAAFTVIVGDGRQAAVALEPLLETFMLVAADGEVLIEEDESGERWTPNYVAPLEVADSAVLVSMDVKGEMMASMGRTFVRLISEALLAAGMTAQIAGWRPRLAQD